MYLFIVKLVPIYFDLYRFSHSFTFKSENRSSPLIFLSASLQCTPLLFIFSCSSSNHCRASSISRSRLTRFKAMSCGQHSANNSWRFLSLWTAKKAGSDFKASVILGQEAKGSISRFKRRVLNSLLISMVDLNGTRALAVSPSPSPSPSPSSQNGSKSSSLRVAVKYSCKCFNKWSGGSQSLCPVLGFQKKYFPLKEVS